MDRSNWPQIVMKPMEELLVPNNLSTKPSPSSSSSSFERRVKPQKAAAVNCPRCDSTNTKFCYYNNYSLSQPRYFCKTCRRYWTEGGTLRNIPVGGGSRKNKRSLPSTNSTTTSSYNNPSVSKNLPDLLGSPSASTVPLLSQNPRIHHGQFGQDLNLGFTTTSNLTNFNNVSEFLQVPNFDAASGMTTSGAMNLFMPVSVPDHPNSVYTPNGQLMIPVPEFKIPSLSFTLDGIGSGGGGGGGYGNGLDQSDQGGRVLFPFGEVKTDTSTTDHADPNEHKDQNCDSNGFWNGMMGGGSW